MTTIVPILKVRDIDRAIDFYCRLLGCREEFRYHPSDHGPSYAGLLFDGQRLHLSTFGGDSVAGAAVYFYVDDVDALYQRFRSAGLAKVELEPTNQDWRQREMYIRDPDGNALRFGTPLP
jgi:uncharacterized glyoxalase superfamily protein PhnB